MTSCHAFAFIACVAELARTSLRSSPKTVCARALFRYMAAAPSLHQAARCGDAAAAADALARGASPAERNKARSRRHHLLRPPPDAPAPRQLGATALHYAAMAGAEAVVSLLLARGADADAVDSRRVPLWLNHALACNSLSLGFPRHSDNTPLHCAALPRSPAAGALLLAAGADAAACDEDGDTPLHEAARWERVTLARALLDAGADADAANCCGWTPLHAAAAYGREGAARVLLTAGADAEARTSEGRTAAELAKTEALRQLILAAGS